MAIEDIDATGRVHVDVGDVTEHFGTGVESGPDLGHLYQQPSIVLTWLLERVLGDSLHLQFVAA